MWKWWIEHLRFALPPLKKPLFQSEGKCKAIDMKMSFFILMEMISQYHNKGFALRLVLKAKVFGTWKWLIRNWPITMTFKPWHSFEGLGGLFCNRQFKGPISKPIDVEGETSNFYGTRKKSRGGFNPANWRKPHRILFALSLGLIIPRGQFVSGHVVLAKPRPFTSDMSPKWIDREGLGERRTGTRQATRQAILYSSLPILENFSRSSGFFFVRYF